MKIDRDLNEDIIRRIEEFPKDIRDVAFDLLDEIQRGKATSELERFILDELSEIL